MTNPPIQPIFEIKGGKIDVKNLTSLKCGYVGKDGKACEFAARKADVALLKGDDVPMAEFFCGNAEHAKAGQAKLSRRLALALKRRKEAEAVRPQQRPHTHHTAQSISAFLATVDQITGSQPAPASKPAPKPAAETEGTLLSWVKAEREAVAAKAAATGAVVPVPAMPSGEADSHADFLARSADLAAGPIPDDRPEFFHGNRYSRGYMDALFAAAGA